MNESKKVPGWVKAIYATILVAFAVAMVVLGANSPSMEPINVQDINHTPAPITKEQCK